MIADSIRVVSMFQVLSSISIKTGTPPSLIIALAHEMIVKEGMITSSPGSIPIPYAATSIAAVPLVTATPYFLSL